jgi:hypothetical protein
MKKLIVILLLLIAAGAAAVFFLREQEYAVVVSQEEIQARLDGAFPIERQYLLVLSLRLSDPEVRLQPGSDRIHMQMRATASAGPVGRNLQGGGRISGRLRYDASTREVYLDDSIVEELEVEGVPQEYRGRLVEIANLGVGQGLDRRPVYTLDQEFLDQIPGPIELRAIRVEDGRVRLLFGIGRRGDAAP